jgi:hypothetical protein
LYYEKGSKLRKLERQLLSNNKPKLNVKSYWLLYFNVLN